MYNIKHVLNFFRITATSKKDQHSNIARNSILCEFHWRHIRSFRQSHFYLCVDCITTYLTEILNVIVR